MQCLKGQFHDPQPDYQFSQKSENFIPVEAPSVHTFVWKIFLEYLLVKIITQFVEAVS